MLTVEPLVVGPGRVVHLAIGPRLEADRPGGPEAPEVPGGVPEPALVVVVIVVVVQDVHAGMAPLVRP